MNLDRLACIGLAFSSATRLHIFHLADGHRSLKQIAGAVGICPSTVTHHVRQLVDAGLIAVDRRGRRHVPRRVEDGWRILARELGMG